MPNFKGTNVKPGIVDPAGHPIRLDLELLGEQDLFNLARNPDARHWKLALTMLVERCSKYLRRPEIAEEVAKLLADDPENPKQPCQTN
jgi:hypothetical protein